MELSTVERKRLAVTPERRAELQARLLVAVERLLGEGESYPELSVERLIRAAGISRATFYIYFRDKGALLGALADGVVVDLIERSEGWWNRPRPASRAELRARLRPVVAAYRSHALLLAAVSDTGGQDERLREKLRTLVALGSARFADSLRAGQAAGGVRPELDPDAIAPFLIWMAERALNQLLIGASDADADRYASSLADLLWFALYDYEM